jgi:hypothetical protein
MSLTIAPPAAADPISAGLSLGTAVTNLVAQLMAEANSPDAVKAAQAKEKLAQWDQLATAQQNNDLQTEREFLERRMAALQSK